jgi:hypothetical protein
MARPLRTIEAECVICQDVFTYTYKGGPYRLTCSPEHQRARKTANKAVERDRKVARPSGYVPDDYPTGVATGLPSKDELLATIERTNWLSRRRQLRTQTADESDAGIGQVRFANDEDPDEVGPNDGPNDYRQLIEAGHGYVMDDFRNAEEDSRLLWYVPKGKRPAVKRWFRQHPEPPIAGFPGIPWRPGDRSGYVLGIVDDGEALPPRLTRRWCSQSTLAPLEGFAWSL